MKFRFPSLHAAIFLGMLGGALYGYFVPQGVFLVKPLGDIFIRLLKMLVVPLIFVSIVDAIIRIGDAKKLSKYGFKTTAYYLGTNFIAVCISLFLVNWIRPGEGVQIFGESPAKVLPQASAFHIIPENIFSAFAQGDTIQIIFFAIVLGVGLVYLSKQTPALSAWFHEANILIMKITEFVIFLAPVAVFALIASMVEGINSQTAVGIGKFALTLLLGLGIHGVIVLPVLFKLFSGRPLIPFLKNVWPALASAFSTSSSAATLPISLQCMEERVKMKTETPKFVLPIGATVNMDGTAMYEAVACLFVAQAVGIDLSFSAQLVVFFTASLAAIGAAAIPSAGLVTLIIVLKAVNLPLEGIAFLLAIDRPFDMSRTTVNVWGDLVGCAVVEGKAENAKHKNWGQA